jgi:2'-5' RNA ligase
MNGLFIVAELAGDVRERVLEIQRRFDPKLAKGSPPHITLAGSSGVGPLPVRTPLERVREVLEPIVAAMPPITVRFEPPHRFITTDIIVLPIPPHGPLRTLHERIAASGLPFPRGRHLFAPHVTLNFYRSLTPAAARQLLALRVDDPIVIDRIQCYERVEPNPQRTVLELRLADGRMG